MAKTEAVDITEPNIATLSVRVVAPDPFARDGLERALSDEGLAAPTEGAQAHCTVVLGPPEASQASQASLAETDAPTLALVYAPEEAQQALSRGAHGVVHATAAPLYPVVAAVAAGHYVIAPEYVDPAWFTLAPERDETLRLTPREHEVLALLADGSSNGAIADALSVSVHTARFHVQSILNKFGAETRTEVVSLAYKSGLLAL